LTDIYAESGYWGDIQNSIDLASNGDNVYIPEGTFNFVNVDEEWEGYRVVIPAGVSLFGVPTERDANGQVIEWKTVLRLPWDVPGSWLGGDGDPPQRGGPVAPFWFEIVGSGDLNKPSRFSDIKLVGYRSIDPESEMILKGIYTENVIDFRVDHCGFEHVAGTGVSTFGNTCRGVIDHCYFENPVAHMKGDWDTESVGYGVAVDRGYGDYWEDDVSKVLGQYTDYTIFIEDCYFRNWRHCTSSGNGAHYVFRYSKIEDDFGFGSVDAHGRGSTIGGVYTQVGTRAIEVYNNQIINAGITPHDPQSWIWGVLPRGGAGVAFNNTFGGGTYTALMYFMNEAPEDASKLWINDWWIWNNTLISGCDEITKYDPNNRIVENVNYFLHAPHTFSYEPYPYPHPLITK